MRSDLHGAAQRCPALLLPRWSLGVRIIRVLLIGFVMSDRASRRSAKFAMARHVASDAANDAPLIHPLASAGEASASTDRQVMAKIVLMIVLRFGDVRRIKSHGGSSFRSGSRWSLIARFAAPEPPIRASLGKFLNPEIRFSSGRRTRKSPRARGKRPAQSLGLGRWRCDPLRVEAAPCVLPRKREP